MSFEGNLQGGLVCPELRRAPAFATGRTEARLVRDRRLGRSLRQSIARFPVLTQPVHGFAQAHRERRNGLEPLLSAVRELPVIFPPNLREQQLRIAKNSRERIVQFVPQHLAKCVGRRIFQREGRQLPLLESVVGRRSELHRLSRATNLSRVGQSKLGNEHTRIALGQLSWTVRTASASKV